MDLDVQQACCQIDGVRFVGIDPAIGLGDLPHPPDHALAFVTIEASMQHAGEAVDVDRVSLAFVGDLAHGLGLGLGKLQFAGEDRHQAFGFVGTVMSVGAGAVHLGGDLVIHGKVSEEVPAEAIDHNYIELDSIPLKTIVDAVKPGTLVLIK